MGYVGYCAFVVMGYDADFALRVLPVTFEDSDVLGVGGNCTAFEEDE